MKKCEEEAEVDVFGEIQKLKRTTKKKQLSWMHHTHRTTEGKKCGDCEHFIRKQYANVYFGCLKYGDTGGAATDWRVNWEACGLFKESK